MADHRNRVSGLLFDEGGLGKDLRDNASRNPVPDGSGYHTNKGVTWGAFVQLSKKLGYQATPELFYKMPKDIWLKIYKIGFWDAVKGDQIKSQAIADMVSDIGFNSGPGRAAQLAQRACNNLGYKPRLPESTTFGPLTLEALNKESNTKIKERQLLLELGKVRMDFFRSLEDWPTFKNGWTTRVENLVTQGLKIIGKPKIAGLFFLGAAAAMVVIYKNETSNSK